MFLAMVWVWIVLRRGPFEKLLLCMPVMQSIGPTASRNRLWMVRCLVVLSLRSWVGWLELRRVWIPVSILCPVTVLPLLVPVVPLVWASVCLMALRLVRVSLALTALTLVTGLTCLVMRMTLLRLK